MSEALKPNNLGVSGLLELARMVAPPGHETVGFEDEGGNFYSLEQLKALEGRENKMDLIQKAIDSLKLQSDAKPKFVRQVRKCFHFGDSFIAVANDDTAWVLRGGMRPGEALPYWEQLIDAQTPPLPQPEGF